MIYTAVLDEKFEWQFVGKIAYIHELCATGESAVGRQFEKH